MSTAGPPQGAQHRSPQGEGTSASAGTHPFTDGLRDGVLRYQRCADCGRAQTPTRLACTHCGSTQLAWLDASGRGTVIAVSIVSRAPSDAFRALVPYTLVLVTLAEGCCVMGHAAPGTAIGDRVVAGTFVHDAHTLLRFTPSDMP